MTTPRSISPEQAREEYRKKRLERARKADPTMPAPEANGVLGPIAGDNRDLWPKPLWGSVLTIKVPDSVPLYAQDKVYFYLDGTLLVVRQVEDPSDPSVRRYDVAADKFSKEGSYAFTYHIENPFGNESVSAARQLYVDHTPPNDNNPGTPPGLPPEIITDGLTLAYLDANPSLDVSIPRSTDITAGDQIRVYWGHAGDNQGTNQADPTEPVATLEVTETAALPGSGDPVVSIPSDDIKALPDGLIWVVYRYVDRTGNLGQPSKWQEINVDLDPLAANLVAPEVPLAADGFIDREDARMGVQVLIPKPGYDNQQPAKDRIQVRWENTDVPAVPLSGFPMEIFVDWPTLSAGGAADVRSFKVSYSVLRGAAKFQSPEIDVAVDFSVAGVEPEPDPDPAGPDPINNKLPKVVIKSRASPPVDNVLAEADKGVDALAQLSPNPVVDGDILRLYWGGLTPYVDEVTVGSPPADPVEFTVPWDKIQEGGYNEKLPVYYSTWNGVNEQESSRTNVDVRIVEAIGLAPVEFPDKDPEYEGPLPLINCCSLPWNGIHVVVPGDKENFTDGDKVTVSWQAYEDLDGTRPITGTDYVFPDVTLTATTAEAGFDLVVPYDNYVEPIVTYGSARVTYLLTKISGQTGSSETRVLVTRVSPSGCCTPEDPGFCRSTGKR